MSGNLYLRAIKSLQRIENVLFMWITGRPFPPAELSLAAATNMTVGNKIKPSTSLLSSLNLEKLMQESFVFAVPKHRRSLERRMMRRFGFPDLVWKPFVPKTNLLNCNSCGHSYEAGHLCMHCYNKVQEETKLMQDAVQSELGLDPVDKEVIILYKGEKKEQPDEYWQGKRIVELDKERPAWFSKNLLQKTTQPSSTSKDVKPTELG